MADVEVYQARSQIVAEGGDLRTSQFRMFAVANFPTEFLTASQAGVHVVAGKQAPIEVPQFRAFVYALGRPQNANTRAWGFSLDNHDFYVLRLGEDLTLVLDLTTGEWVPWDTLGRVTWRAHLGQNWFGAGAGNFFGGLATNIIAGDDTYGLLWTLDPEQGFDDHPVAELEPQYFIRSVTGGMAMRMRQATRLNAAFLTVSLGFPAPDGAAITMLISRDNGRTWEDQGAVPLTTGGVNQELLWRSLGVVKAPGFLLRFDDTGATVRIDGANVRLADED